MLALTPKKAGSPVPCAPATIQTVKHKRVFENTVELRIEDGRRKGVGWSEAWRRVSWYLTFDGAAQRLGDFLFGK